MGKFFDKNEILQKAKKIYESGKIFKSFIDEEDIFPLCINMKKITETDIKNSFSAILKEIDEIGKSNLPIKHREFQFKSIGIQKLPVVTEFENRESFLNALGKREEFDEFIKYYKMAVGKFPTLKEVVYKRPKIILENLSIWSELLEICTFFIDNPKPNIYTRELSIEGVDTKFIEKHKKVLDTLLSNIHVLFDDNISTLSHFGFEKKYFLKYPLATIRFRILDDSLSIAGLTDLSVTIKEFEELNIKCEKVFIVENKITTLSFPKVEKSIVIFGSGFGVQSIKNVKWMKDKELFYWGDIDSDGFAILSQIRGYFKNIKSIFMDKEIVELFGKLSVKENENKRVLYNLKNLKTEEKELFERLQNNYYGKNFRLEQERIPFEFIQDKIKERRF